MKKSFILILALFCSSLQGLPLGNPYDPALYSQGIWTDQFTSEMWHIRAGYYGDFVFNRNLEIKDDTDNVGKIIRKTHIRTNAGYLALNIWDHVEAFGTVGATRFDFNTSEISWFPQGNQESFLYTDTCLSWSVGGRITGWAWKCLKFGVEGQYFRANPLLTQFISLLNGYFNYFDTNNEACYQEWQVGAGVSYLVQTYCPNVTFVPYIGGKWARSHFTTNNFQFIKTNTLQLLTIPNMVSHKKWGFVVGTTFTFCDRIGFTAEGRFADERALYINGQFSF